MGCCAADGDSSSTFPPFFSLPFLFSPPVEADDSSASLRPLQGQVRGSFVNVAFRGRPHLVTLGVSQSHPMFLHLNG